MEYQVIHIDPITRRARLSLRAHDTLFKLIDENPTQWHPEYARWMLESTPSEPYSYTLQALAWGCEQNMRSRRQMASRSLVPNEKLFSMTTFPALGSFDSLWDANKEIPKDAPYSHSKLLPDIVISSHPRFSTLTSNIRKRRGSIPIKIALPVFRDYNTDWPFYDSIIDNNTKSDCYSKEISNNPISQEDLNLQLANQLPSICNSDQKPPNSEGLLFVDAMGFGMGLCCLQTTIQCPSLESARLLYDSFAVLAPIMLALTASTPAMKSFLLDVDARWDIISAAVDDRSPEELGANLKLKKSRYASISTFLSTSSSALNDFPLPVNVRMYDSLVRGSGGSDGPHSENTQMDSTLAKHFGYLFVRDPLVLYSEKASEYNDESNEIIEVVDPSSIKTISTNEIVFEESMFECIQSTNWNTVRLKLPSTSLGLTSWRIEFRPMEAQVTDFESAAFVTFIQLIAASIISSNGNKSGIGLIPISKLDLNMSNAQKRDAVRLERFHWVVSSGGSGNEHHNPQLLTLDEIVNGQNGLLSVARSQLSLLFTTELNQLHHLHVQPNQEVISAQLDTIERYLSFIGARASGRIPTPARAIREFILEHSSYAKNSFIPDEIVYDLINKLALHSELNIPILDAI